MMSSHDIGSTTSGYSNDVWKEQYRSSDFDRKLYLKYKLENNLIRDYVVITHFNYLPNLGGYEFKCRTIRDRSFIGYMSERNGSIDMHELPSHKLNSNIDWYNEEKPTESKQPEVVGRCEEESNTTREKKSKFKSNARKAYWTRHIKNKQNEGR